VQRVQAILTVRRWLARLRKPYVWRTSFQAHTTPGGTRPALLPSTNTRSTIQRVAGASRPRDH
jgi:hypothetical protein